MADGTRAIVTDIEGTTSSIAFVTDVLFPYAKAHLAEFVARNASRAAPILADVAEGTPGDPVETLLRWIDEDRKATPLKTLQGMIWAEGYADGTLTGHVYPDATAALRRWHAAIARAIGLPPSDILFLSDAPAEIDAARAAGLRALLVDRDGGNGDVARFDEVRA
jgi:enolase-phosphatase E1